MLRVTRKISKNMHDKKKIKQNICHYFEPGIAKLLSV